MPDVVELPAGHDWHRVHTFWRNKRMKDRTLRSEENGVFDCYDKGCLAEVVVTFYNGVFQRRSKVKDREPPYLPSPEEENLDGHFHLWHCAVATDNFFFYTCRCGLEKGFKHPASDEELQRIK